jgi:hypothetical protein
MATTIKLRRGIKANLPTLNPAEPAFTTDTFELFIGSSAGNKQIGLGDMLKSIYDTNDSGVVDNSEKLNGNAASYYLDRTNHTGSQDASTITQDSTHRMVSDTQVSSWTGKQDALGFTPVPNTRTVNGKALNANIALTASDVSAEPTLTKSNLTESVSSVLTINGGTGAIIGNGLTIQVKQASTSVSGYLSSTDWNTFNDKQAALGFTPVNKSGDTMSGVLTSTVSTGTAPFVVASTTLVSNLNVNYLNGKSSSDFALAGADIDCGTF